MYWTINIRVLALYYKEKNECITYAFLNDDAPEFLKMNILRNRVPREEVLKMKENYSLCCIKQYGKFTRCYNIKQGLSGVALYNTNTPNLVIILHLKTL